MIVAFNMRGGISHLLRHTIGISDDHILWLPIESLRLIVIGYKKELHKFPPENFK